MYYHEDSDIIYVFGGDDAGSVEKYALGSWSFASLNQNVTYQYMMRLAYFPGNDYLYLFGGINTTFYVTSTGLI